jgi:hypothetical protein
MCFTKVPEPKRQFTRDPTGFNTHLPREQLAIDKLIAFAIGQIQQVFWRISSLGRNRRAHDHAPIDDVSHTSMVDTVPPTCRGAALPSRKSPRPPARKARQGQKTSFGVSALQGLDLRLTILFRGNHPIEATLYLKTSYA